MSDDMVTVRRSDLFVVFQVATGHQPDPNGLTPFALERIAGAIGGCTEIEQTPRSVLEPGGFAPSTFDAFWMIYPRKVGKKAARRAWDKAIKEATEADILYGAERFRDHWADQPKERLGFIPYPATWLNAGSWEDELVPHAGQASKVDKTRRNLMAGAEQIGAGQTFEERMAAAGQRALGA